ncbi:MAG TPA: hypothetical protein PK530_14325 [Anaerolineales bacterium]|nr:hypothetical protein [Anaerolineales bacterium]
MSINANLYREAFEYYRQWNEAELKAQAHQAGQLSPEERWEQYKTLWQFCAQLAGPPSENYLKHHFGKWADYYEKMHQFETWKQQNAT